MNRRSHAVAQLVASLALVWGYVLTDWFWVASASLGCPLWAVGIALWPSRKVQVGTARPEKPTGILSMSEFAEECDKLLRVKADPEPEPPDALPSGLRDTGFAASRRKQRDLEQQLWMHPSYETARKHAREMQHWQMRLEVMSMSSRKPSSICFRDEAHLRADDRAKVDAIPLRAQRSYTALTHCPEGHIGDHWIGDLTDEDTVTRTCAWAKCGATWQEKAWTTAA